jgi:crotonobetainyl-CoA:carnitine CoA-transferase CaiB-like acyl-CoA transferase
VPLTGLKVLELANILAGPLIGQFCAELGADVVKVEQPDSGDPTRGWRLAGESASQGVSAYFSCANAGKRSIALDLRRTAGRAVVDRLVQRSDVLIMGYKPGDERKFGLEYQRLQRLNPRLIYLQITAYGSADPRPGFDAIIQAESGFTYLNGEAGGPALKMPVALVDLLAAHQLKEGLLLALRKRDRTGIGSYVATSLLGSAAASLANQATNYLVAGQVPQRMGSEHPNIVPYGSSFASADGVELVLAVGTERQYRGLTEALDAPQLRRDSRFADNATRVEHRVELNAALAQRIAQIPSATLAAALRARKVPFGFINDMREVFEQPAAQAQILDDGAGLRSIALSGDIEGRTSLGPPPRLNEQGQQILEELGFDEGDLAALAADRGWQPTA